MGTAVERIGKDRILINHRFTDFAEKDGKVLAPFDGQPDQESDILIAVDGIHSQARHIFYPEEGPPAYSGHLMWRAVSQGKPYLSGATMAVVGHYEIRLVAYPISVADETGECEINWIRCGCCYIFNKPTNKRPNYIPT